MKIDKTKPFLRWAGSKRKLISKLSPFWDPKFKRYIEPFMGSACLFFSIRPSSAILNDINSELVETYIAVRDEHKEVFKYLKKMTPEKEYYYKIRSIDPSLISRNKRAARFIYLNRFCFNGLYRTNLKGQFNVPYAPMKTGKLPTLTELENVSQSLSNAEIKNNDFETVINGATKGDFVYMDPPFVVSTRRIFRQYYPSSFNIIDLERLSSKLIDLDRRGVKFLVSYALCKEALKCFKVWKIKRVVTQRNISGFSKHRRRAIELLISN